MILSDVVRKNNNQLSLLIKVHRLIVMHINGEHFVIHGSGCKTWAADYQTNFLLAFILLYLSYTRIAAVPPPDGAVNTTSI